MRDTAPPFVHPSALVDPGAVLGAGCKVWHFSHVMPGARIGAESVLGQNVYVGGAAVVGERCKIANNVSLYEGVVQAVEETVLNVLMASETMIGRDNHRSPGFPVERLSALLR